MSLTKDLRIELYINYTQILIVVFQLNFFMTLAFYFQVHSELNESELEFGVNVNH